MPPEQYLATITEHDESMRSVHTLNSLDLEPGRGPVANSPTRDC
jgi:hypothetical protein